MACHENNKDIKTITVAFLIAATALGGCVALVDYFKKQDKNPVDKVKAREEKPIMPTPALDTAYVLDAKNFYEYNHAAIREMQNVNRIYMVTKSGREIIQDVRKGRVGYFVQPGDTVLINRADDIVTSMRHQRMKNKFVRGR